ncbi:hypothetical protein FLAG1_06600 [Fusarium langsethiae]|uniref:Uncharacterized protein n=1 Tax=Fusarium langsethiae TaxID=179993 RepID=A0A0M9EV39_FUSLA|nr:hypothetical protein FLAG1_06600 [Fusarium langsethiae]
MSSINHVQDVERQSNHNDWISHLAPRDAPDLRERAEQGCFICLESHNQGQYAVLVPCQRPKPRQIIFRREHDNGKPEYVYRQDSSMKSACDSDREIYERLLDTCYQHLGWWKRWLPYFGITEVLEVNFQFAGAADADGRYPIYMEPLNLEDISENCMKAIARHPTSPGFDGNDACQGGSHHSDQCIAGMEDDFQPCIRIKAEEAEQRRKKFLFVSHLKECARDPQKANGLHSLEGRAQESCIYDIKGSNKIDLPLPYQELRCKKWRRGLQFVLGWQTDRIRTELPFGISCASLAIALIWLSLVVWKGAGGDWGTAFAFAQVVAASFAIVITYARL